MKKIITPNNISLTSRFNELIESIDLILLLAYRDFKVRYSQTLLGFLWVIIQPIFTLLVFSVVFGYALDIDTNGIPYPVFMMSGMITWGFFSYVFSQSGTSIIQSQSLITKIYFPRLAIPLSKALVGLIDFAVLIILTSFFMLYYGIIPKVHILYLPFYLFLAIIFSLSMGILISAISIRFRDFQHTIPFILQLGIYITPVAYPSKIIPEKFQWLYYSNPMAVIIEGTRYSLFGINPPDFHFIIYCSIIIFIIMILSFVSFVKIENKIADIV